ncbi:MAG: DUF1858 domain-containing protein [Nanoarchaeota archaeon]|nr:DUF1858 domain-containing protein [Nanoarchaeota archaeon]
MAPKIEKTMTIGEIVEKNPELAEIMFNHGLHCIGCNVALWETLEEGCKAHGLAEEEIDLMVTEMNDKLGQKKDGK